MIETLLWLGGYIGRFFHACYTWFSGNNSAAKPPVVLPVSIDDVRLKSTGNKDSSIGSEISVDATYSYQVAGSSTDESLASNGARLSHGSQDSKLSVASFKKTTIRVEATAMFNDEEEKDVCFEGESIAPIVVQQSTDEVRYQIAIRILKAIKVIPESEASTILEEQLWAYTRDAISVGDALDKLRVNGCTCVVILHKNSTVSPQPIQGTYYIQEVFNQPSKVRVYRSEDEELIEKIFEKPPYISELIKKVITAGGTSTDPVLCEKTTILGCYNSKDRVYAKILGFGPGATFYENLARNQEDCQSRTKKLLVLFAPQQIVRQTHLSAAVRSVYQFIWELLHPIHTLVNGKEDSDEIERLKVELRQAQLDAQKAADSSHASEQRFKEAAAYLEELKEESERLYPTIVEATTPTRGFNLFDFFGRTKVSSRLKSPAKRSGASSSLDLDEESVDLTAASEVMDDPKAEVRDVLAEKKAVQHLTFGWFTAKKAAVAEEVDTTKKKTLDSTQSDGPQTECKRVRYSLLS